jgi:hypothetical protein
MTSQAMPLYNDNGTNTGRLRLKADERRLLQRDLERTFGASVRKGPREGQRYLPAAAAFLYQFLGNTRWRSLDSR